MAAGDTSFKQHTKNDTKHQFDSDNIGPGQTVAVGHVMQADPGWTRLMTSPHSTSSSQTTLLLMIFPHSMINHFKNNCRWG